LNPKEVETIKAYKSPTNLKELCSFLRMASDLRRSIEGFTRKVSHVTELLKKGSFDWNVIAQESFERVMSALVSAPTLKLPNFNLPFEIEINTCDVRVRARLRQGHRVIANESRKLKSSETSYPINEKEILIILLALARWCHYIYGVEFVLYIDHHSLKYWLMQEKVNSRQARWLEFL